MNYLEAIKEYIIRTEKDLPIGDINGKFSVLLSHNSSWNKLWNNYQYTNSDFIVKELSRKNDASWILPFFKLIISIRLHAPCYFEYKKTIAGPYDNYSDNCRSTAFSRYYYNNTPYSVALYYYNWAKEREAQGKLDDIAQKLAMDYEAFKKNESILISLMLMYRWTCCVQW